MTPATPRRILGVVRPLFLAALLTAALMSAAIAGNYVTTAPRLVNLLVEPFSLLLIPGLLVALAFANGHDYLPETVVEISAALHFLFFFGTSCWWERSRTPAATDQTSPL